MLSNTTPVNLGADLGGALNVSERGEDHVNRHTLPKVPDDLITISNV